MDTAFVLTKDSPRKNANFLSKLCFTWMLGLFRKGAKTNLEVSDLYRTLKCNKSEKLGNKLERNWFEEIKRAEKCNVKPSLLRAIFKTFFWRYMMYGLAVFFAMIAIRSPQPILLSYIIKAYDPNSESTIDTIYILSGGLILMTIVNIFITHHTTFGQNAVGMRIRVAVSTLIYRKMMRLNTKALGETAAGQVINLLSNDVQRFDTVCFFLHFLWILPFQIALVTYFLWQQVGVACLAGVLTMALLSLPAQGFLAKLLAKFRLSMAHRTDARVKLMSEVISGIQVIKMYAWEKPFEKMIHLLRKREVKVLTKISYIRGIYMSSMVFIERTTLYLTLVAFVLPGNFITADIVFSMAQFFNILQLAMAGFYPLAISSTAEALVSIKRLENFLFLDEREDSKIDNVPCHEIKMSGVSAGWDSSKSVLHNINLFIPEGTLCAVVGPVGAGKSSLLQLLLSELVPSSGEIELGGEISYASQNAWLFQSTVKNNILFGNKYDPDLYREVVKVCALREDFKQFPQGDKTIVGERGVSLSGGQRARINLARAVYRQADIYLLDDPLSAVDTHVGKHLFEKCIVNYLKKKTRILVTHQLQYLKKADMIIVLNEGRIEAMGPFEELSKSNLDFTKLLAVADETSDEKTEDITKIEVAEFDNTSRQLYDRSLSIMSFTESVSTRKGPAVEEDEQIDFDSKISPFKEYFKSTRSICSLVSLAFVLITSQLACTCADFWLAIWTTQENVRGLSTDTVSSSVPPLETVEVYNIGENNKSYEEPYYTYTQNEKTGSNFSSMFFDIVVINGQENTLIKREIILYVYTTFILSVILLTVARSTLFFTIAMRASRNLHKKMFSSLLKAPMRFFDTNPSGRIFNRFSKDMGAIDDLLPVCLMEAIQITLVMVGILINVAISNYYMIVAIIITGIIFLKMRRWYILTAKNIKHLEGVAKSPVFSHINSTLNGLTTIRASKAENVLIKEFDEHQDIHTSAWYTILTCTTSFGLWLDIMCVLFLACIAFAFAIAEDLYGNVNSSLVGLALSQALILTGMLQHGMKQTAEVVNQLTSVERVYQYTQLESETPFKTPKGAMPIMPWPNKGHIYFKHVYLRYAKDAHPVLKNLNFSILPGEKVGIVGRTGAGKSSLISALFRLAPIEGAIVIDEVDTSRIGLSDLRKKISIIPQEPVLFSATMRYNLDPFNEFEDSRLWNALEEVELKDVCNSLDFMITEGGSNFSVGQRQLICLARAILRNNRVLVLDEATANVDPQTDALIQETIRRKFESCTVLTIAHRLNTIMDSDKVIVMSFGEVLEMDHPHNLLQIENGHFHKMVLETGPNMTQQLKDVALSAWQDKYAVDHL